MMKYPKSYLEEITQRLKVSDVVGGTVKLTKRGKEFVGLSPFTNEKTPSFTVNDEKGFYHCFSSGEHGGIFDFPRACATAGLFASNASALSRSVRAWARSPRRDAP